MRILTAIALILGVTSAGLAAPENNFFSRLWEAQGLTHPMVVHFPIAMLIAAALGVVLRTVVRGITLNVVYYCLVIGAGGAIVSTLAGWAWAASKGYGDVFNVDGDVFWHRWGGVIITVAAVFIAFWATQAIRRGGNQVGWQLAVILLAVGTGLVGHQGGELVYPGNLEKIMAKLNGTETVAPPPVLAAAGPATTGDPAIDTSAEPESDSGETAAQTAADDAAMQPSQNAEPTQSSPAKLAKVNFATQVWPIFEAKCIDCHGAEKDRGDLRMHTEADALKGGDTGPAYIKGNSRESLIVELMTAEDILDRMPPEEEEPVTSEELQLIARWIDEGAEWNLPAPASTASKAP